MKKVKILLSFLIIVACSKAQDVTTINPFESVIIEMVCDCNPSQVLNTFVTDANGIVKITVPKDANYSFKLVVPPAVKEKGIKVADLANDVVVNFKGTKDVESIAFNNKGVAAEKNLQQGNYEIALNRKPPKGGPKGPPPSRKCPPGEIPWCGGCIPADVVNKVQADVWAICCRQGNKACCDMAPKPSIEGIALANGGKTAADINCPTGKYDAKGNCIFASTNTTENKAKMFSVFSVDAGYLGSANANNNKESKPLFAGSGLSAGLNYRYGAKWGITGRIGYAGGSRSQSNLNDFASTLTKAPWVYKITGFTKTWSQVNFAAGPSIFLGKNYKGEISIVGGVSMGSESKIKIDLYDANTFYKNVYDVTEKKMKVFWEVGGSYSFAKISKRSVFGIKGSYGSAGGSFGFIFSITEQVCVGAPCFRCQGAGCLGEMPKSPSAY